MGHLGIFLPSPFGVMMLKANLIVGSYTIILVLRLRGWPGSGLFRNVALLPFLFINKNDIIDYNLVTVILYSVYNFIKRHFILFKLI